MPRLDFAVEKRLKRLAARRPELSLRAGAALGAMARSPRWTPTRAEVADAFGVSDPRRIAGIRRSVGARELRNTLFRALVNRRGVEAVADRVAVVGADRLLALCARGTPPVIIFAHLGVPRAIEAGLARLGLRALVAAAQPPRHASERVRFHKVGAWTEGAQFLLRALRELRAGGLPVLSFDAVDRGSRDDVLLGRPVPIARGPAFLARKARAPVVPMSARWLGSTGRIEVRIHEPLPPPARGASPEAYEAALMSGSARWLEAQLRRRPWELRLDRLRVHAARTPCPSSGDRAQRDAPAA